MAYLDRGSKRLQNLVQPFRKHIICQPIVGSEGNDGKKWLYKSREALANTMVMRREPLRLHQLPQQTISSEAHLSRRSLGTAIGSWGGRG